jgi:AraC-like DNA-binding protein
MQAAAMRLRACDLSVGEIAAEFGYDSASAFARAFRRWSGAAPVAWREQERGSEHLVQQAFRISKGQKVL